MSDLLIKNKNHSMMHVGCDYGVANELSDFFSFFVPGYKYMPAYRNRVWDGKIRLFNVQSMELPVGLYPFLQEFCKPRQYQIEVEDDTYYGRPDSFLSIDASEVYDYVKSLKLRSRGKPIDIREYQFDAV